MVRELFRRLRHTCVSALMFVTAILCCAANAALADSSAPQPAAVQPDTMQLPTIPPAPVTPPTIELPDPVSPASPASDLIQVGTFDPLWLIKHSNTVLAKKHILGRVGPDVQGYGLVVPLNNQAEALLTLRADAAAIGYPLHLDPDSTLEIEPDDTSWLVDHINTLFVSNHVNGTVDTIQDSIDAAPADAARAKALLLADSKKIGYTLYIF